MSAPHKHAELIKAWADGAEVQFWSKRSSAWMPVPKAPAWSVSTKYRVKPTPDPYAEVRAAQAAGRTVQMLIGKTWVDPGVTGWNFSATPDLYRIKPEPKSLEKQMEDLLTRTVTPELRLIYSTILDLYKRTR